MYTTETSRALNRLFSELVDGTSGDAFILNTGDVGLLRSFQPASHTSPTISARSVKSARTCAAPRKGRSDRPDPCLQRSVPVIYTSAPSPSLLGSFNSHAVSGANLRNARDP